MATPPAKTSRPTPVWARVLVGCAIVGGLVVVALFVAFAMGMYWMLSPGQQAPTETVASADAIGVVRMGDLAADPGAREFLSHVITEMQRAGQAQGGPQLPEWLQGLQAAQARQGLTQWIPREVTVSIEPGPDDTIRTMTAINPRGFVRPIKLAIVPMLKQEKGVRVGTHGGHEVITLPSGTAFVFADGTLVIGDGAIVNDAIDRLAAGVRSPPPTTVAEARSEWDVHGWLRGEAAVNTMRLFVAAGADDDEEGTARRAPARDLAADVKDVRFGVDLQGPDEAAVLIDVGFGTSDSAGGAEPALTSSLAQLREHVAANGLTVGETHERAGERVRYTVKVSGLADAFEKWLAQSQQHAERRRHGGREPAGR